MDATDDVLREEPVEGGGGVVDGTSEGGVLNLLVVEAAPRVDESVFRGDHDDVRPAGKLGLVRS